MIGLRHCRDGDRVLDPRGHVAHAELQRAKRRVRPDVPPDPLAVVDAVEVDQQVHVALVLAPRAEVIGDTRPREAPEDRRAIRLEAGVAPHPERRAGRQRQQVRQEVPRGVHDVDRRRLVRHGDVDVQPEDEQRARQLLQFLDDVLVPLTGRDDLIDPRRERVRAGGGHGQADAVGRRAQLRSDLQHLVLELADVLADVRADLHDRLVHLALHLVAQRPAARGQQLRDVRAEFPGVGIDDLELLLDANREPVGH